MNLNKGNPRELRHQCLSSTPIIDRYGHPLPPNDGCTWGGAVSLLITLLASLTSNDDAYPRLLVTLTMAGAAAAGVWLRCCS